MGKFLVMLFCFLCIKQESKLKTSLNNVTYTETLIAGSFIWQGHERSYWLHLPPDKLRNKPLPVLFNLHGGGGTGKGAARLTGNRFNQLADRDGFIVVYPDGLKRRWNDGRKVGANNVNEAIDDVGFILEIIKKLSKSYPVDSNRIFTSGMSNGGFMSSRLLCEHPDTFRGGAIVTATIPVGYIQHCKPQTPVAVIVINGTDDPIVPYEGGDIRLFKFGKKRGEIVSTDDYLKFLQNKNGCSEKVKTVELPDKQKEDGTTVSLTTYTSCSGDGALKLFKIKGGGHTWPGGRQYLPKKRIGNTSYEINACDEIWSFFRTLN